VDVALKTYKDALDYLFARTTGSFKFGLERTIALLDALGSPHQRFPSIHIAGTNGKGSSVATAEALLAGRGLRVAKYTSPHLVSFRERIVADGAPIPSDVVLEFVQRYTPLVEQLGATFFEATTAMAFDHFARSEIDVAVIEAGLGGRLDSTNVITPLVAGVTSIGFDHVEYLGNTLEAIASEKAGIFKPGIPAVVGEQDAGIRAFLAERASERGATPVRVAAQESGVADVVVEDGGTRFTMSLGSDRRRLSTPLAGRHQASNVAFTLVLLDAAGPPYAASLEDAARLLPNVRIPGRFEHVGRFIFDVAHNAAGAAVLAETIRSVDPPRPLTALVSVLRDKEWRQMLRELTPIVDHFVLSTAPTAPASRVWSLQEALAFAVGEGWSAEAVEDFDAAIDRAQADAATTLITGSFHTVGDAMSRLQVSPLSG